MSPSVESISSMFVLPCFCCSVALIFGLH
jgi:hypothetical protein